VKGNDHVFIIEMDYTRRNVKLTRIGSIWNDTIRTKIEAEGTIIGGRKERIEVLGHYCE
jgi:hypothetical protein